MHDAALHGSSHYELPGVLRWFTANIGVPITSAVEFPIIGFQKSCATTPNSRQSGGLHSGKASAAFVRRFGTRGAADISPFANYGDRWAELTVSPKLKFDGLGIRIRSTCIRYIFSLLPVARPNLIIASGAGSDPALWRRAQTSRRGILDPVEEIRTLPRKKPHDLVPPTSLDLTPRCHQKLCPPSETQPLIYQIPGGMAVRASRRTQQPSSRCQ